MNHSAQRQHARISSYNSWSDPFARSGEAFQAISGGMKILKLYVFFGSCHAGTIFEIGW
jgi:hypothetical protein